MNYIKRLEAELARAKEVNAQVQERIHLAMEHIASPKFTGIDLDGSRKDWIATSDVQMMLTDFKSTLMED